MSLESHLHKEFTKLMKKHWKFIDSQWPEMKPSKYHRTDKKDICDMKHIKEVVVNRLGIIPVFFFLIVLYPFKHHPGPYRNVEKGLLILYHLLKGISYSDMGTFIPQSSFHDIHKSFYGRENNPNNELDEQMTDLLHEMFSNIKISVLSTKIRNPTLFKTVTPFLDGHDTRGKKIGTRSEDGYSYKFKKSGFHTQVWIDINGMILFIQ